MKTHPVLIGVLNAFLPGLGYLLLKERRTFAWLLLLGTATLLASVFTEPGWEIQPFFYATTNFGKVLEGISLTATIIAFGYDAYDLAKKQAPPPFIVPANPFI